MRLVPGLHNGVTQQIFQVCIISRAQSRHRGQRPFRNRTMEGVGAQRRKSCPQHVVGVESDGEDENYGPLQERLPTPRDAWRRKFTHCLAARVQDCDRTDRLKDDTWQAIKGVAE